MESTLILTSCTKFRIMPTTSTIQTLKKEGKLARLQSSSAVRPYPTPKILLEYIGKGKSLWVLTRGWIPMRRQMVRNRTEIHRIHIRHHPLTEIMPRHRCIIFSSIIVFVWMVPLFPKRHHQQKMILRCRPSRSLRSMKHIIIRFTGLGGLQYIRREIACELSYYKRNNAAATIRKERPISRKNKAGCRDFFQYVQEGTLTITWVSQNSPQNLLLCHYKPT